MSHQVNIDTPTPQPQQPDGSPPSQPDIKRALATLMAAVRRDATGAQASADGNYIYLTVTKDGGLRVDSSTGQLNNSLPVTLVIDRDAQAKHEEMIQLLTEIRDQLLERLY